MPAQTMILQIELLAALPLRIFSMFKYKLNFRGRCDMTERIHHLLPHLEHVLEKSVFSFLIAFAETGRNNAVISLTKC